MRIVKIRVPLVTPHIYRFKPVLANSKFRPHGRTVKGREFDSAKGTPDHVTVWDLRHLTGFDSQITQLEFAFFVSLKILPVRSKASIMIFFDMQSVQEAEKGYLWGLCYRFR